ncbi:MAG: thioredoxin [Clostridiales bacterium]|jgi:thioredoxin 1|nr:thioredoxin [Clostridiales bacterium]
MQLLDSASFNEAINNPLPVVIDFYADWCGPCKRLSPILEELAVDNEGKALFYKVNTDDEPELAMQYEVSGIPNVVCFKNGEVYKRAIGLVPKDKLAEILV